MGNLLKKPNGKWQARVSVKGSAHTIGTFETKKEASEAIFRFEKEIKPGLLKPSVEDMLQKDIEKWTKLLPEFKNVDRLTIELVIDKLEILIKEYRKSKKEDEIEKLPSFSIF